MRHPVIISFAVTSCALSALASHAAVVPRDLLGPLGQFEFSAQTSWVSGYSGPDYDYNTDVDWASAPNADGWRFGYSLPSPDDLVAAGWTRESGVSLNPRVNIVCRITPNADNNTNCQYFAVRNTPRGYAGLTICKTIRLSDSASERIDPGDEAVFHIDSIRMSDFAGLAIAFKLRIKMVYKVTVIKNGIETTQTVSEWVPDVDLAPSTNWIRGAQISTVIPANPVSMSIRICMQAWSDLQGREPGVYVDGAHLYVRRNGAYVTEQVPVEPNRTIKTGAYLYDPLREDVYAVARDYYYAVLKYEYDYPYALRLKYYNPNIKVYFYALAGGVTDSRDPATLEETWFCNCPIPFDDVLSKHRDWLYPDPTFDPDNPAPGDNRPLSMRVPYCYSSEYQAYYWTHMDIPELQMEWADESTDKATRYRLDGVFADDPSPLTTPLVVRTAQEVQDFIHGVCPVLRGADPRLQIIGNYCYLHPDTGTGGISFNPFAYNNSPDNVADGFFNEWMFFPHWGDPAVNHYELPDYWLKCLDDMDVIAGWNKTLPADLRKWHHSQVMGIDRPEDPADGIDGWLHFGQCSYLLGQNEWTTYGARLVGSATQYPIDYASINKLGTPGTGHMPYNRSEYCRYRYYYGADQGAPGGIVVVNGSPNTSAIFEPGFDVLDEDGARVAATTDVVLKPHTGRMFFHQNSYKYVSVVTNPTEGQVVRARAFTVTGRVIVNRAGIKLPSYVEVRIDSTVRGSWKRCAVNSAGNWSLPWKFQRYGKHTIYCRAYAGTYDREPDKPGRIAYYLPWWTN